MRRCHPVSGFALATLASCTTPAFRHDPASLPLHYDQAMIAAGFPSPLVKLSVGGRTAWFLVDTGAGVHAFASWFVASAGVKARPSDHASLDTSGNRIPLQVLGPIEVDVEGSPVTLPEATAADFPPLFEQYGLGGVLSPQLLASSGVARLDLRRPALAFVPNGPPQLPRNGQRSQMEAGTVCVNPESKLASRLYAMQVSIDGIPARMLVDTGATRSFLNPGSEAGRRLMRNSVSDARDIRGVGGHAEATRMVRGVELRLGGSVVAMDMGIANVTSECAPDGLLGMDVLRACELDLGTGRFSMACGDRH